MTGILSENPVTGQSLTENEAAERFKNGQGNNFSIPSSRSYFQIFRKNLFTFINTVLFSIGIVLTVLGRPDDALISVGVVFVNLVVSLIQEVRAKRKLDRINLLARPKATIVREGRQRPVDPGLIVLGDLLYLGEGDQVVVDGVLVSDNRINLDESLLTGEADVIPKKSGDPVYSGSFCTSGSGYYRAVRVGKDCLANQLTSGARAYRRVYTPLQRQINLLVRLLVAVATFLGCLLLFNAALEGSTMVESARMTAVVAGLVPSGLFMAITLAYALGAVRMADRGVLVQQFNAIESLSNVDVLCLDKTGTLTTNRLNIFGLLPLEISESDLRMRLGLYAASTPGGNRTIQTLKLELEGQAAPFLAEIPFASERKWSGLTFDDFYDSRNERLILPGGSYILGALEILQPNLSPGLPEEASLKAAEWVGQGLRVLLFSYSEAPLESDSERPVLPDRLQPLGLLAISDQLRTNLKEALDSFARAGIALKIISGDNPRTVRALALQAGLDGTGQTMAGPELDGLTDEELEAAAERVTIFGRVTPLHKSRLVQALRRKNHYVAMIGDGVNDILSIKQANLGIAMESGSQAVRAAADIVLLNDSFTALPSTFIEGHRIRSGMQDIIRLFMSRITFYTLLILSVGVVGLGFPLTPKQSSFLILLTVGLPVIGLALWTEPALASRGNFFSKQFYFVIPAGLAMTVFGLGVYLGFTAYNYLSFEAKNPGLDPAALFVLSEPAAQTALAEFTVLTGLMLVVFAKPPLAWLAVGASLCKDKRPALLALAMLLIYNLVLLIPDLRNFFELAKIPFTHYLVVILAAGLWAGTVFLLWRYKLLQRFLGIRLK